MIWEKPTPAAFWKAVEIYLAAAYDAVPPAVRARLDSLRAMPEPELYQSKVFEPTPKDHPTRLSVRLGNLWYPHMKLAVERAPDGRRSLFRADTHDQHVQVAPGSRDYAAFCEMTRNNQSLASRIEADWESCGIPTFKSFLREDLARRRAGQA